MTIDINSHTPVLIAGPTASGKSALALHIAHAQGGVIVNADALQVFGGWRVLTARPDDVDLASVHHELYGHVPFDAPYSVGHWLRDIAPFLQGSRPIIVGGTGLNFTALTEGLAEIPSTPQATRAAADAMTVDDMLAAIDPETTARIDIANRVRVQRAWEVQSATGRSLAAWQDDTPPPLLPLSHAHAIVLDAPKGWLDPRIETRCDLMLEAGVLDEARAMANTWDPVHQSSKAIGAPELIAHVKGELSLDAAREAIIVGSRQYAKRQRTWFRKKMKNWYNLSISSIDQSTELRFTP